MASHHIRPAMMTPASTKTRVLAINSKFDLRGPEDFNHLTSSARPQFWCCSRHEHAVSIADMEQNASHTACWQWLGGGRRRTRLRASAWSHAR